MSETGRRSVRLPEYDYSEGALFLTMTLWRRPCIFGDIAREGTRLSSIGEIVKDERLRSRVLRGQISLDVWVIMPNHLHAIVWHRMEGVLPASNSHVGAHARPERRAEGPQSKEQCAPTPGPHLFRLT